jgi:flagellar biosynthesis protein FlhB
MADENKTEQATPQRRRKAREKGQIVRSRELSSSLAVVAGLLAIVWQGSSVLFDWRQFLGSLLDRAATGEIGAATPVIEWTMLAAARWCGPAMIGAFTVATVASVAQGGFVFAAESLAPSVERINPAKRISQLVSAASLAALLKSLVPTAAIAVLGYQTVMREWPVILSSAFRTPEALFRFILEHAYEICWRSGLILLLWSGFDYLLIRQKHERDLRMSKNEIREESKESEGNPQTKARMRRIQRQVRRKQMLRDVNRATVVVTNPTHFAIALEYEPDQMSAPVVIAKGRDLLAQQIKDAAMWNNVPMIENPPLAHALYRTVEVGQAIPAKLFAAVAEILAFVYRTQQRVVETRGGR